jgi:alkaline phosphatase
MTNYFQFQRFFLTGSLLLSLFLANAQPIYYSTANAHSHNDYEQPFPFWTAYKATFGSIEADIFLVKGKLLVAHTSSELSLNRSLEDLYLKPLLSCLHKQGGFAYADTSRHLQMLIDVKTDSSKTLDALVSLLQHYPELIHSATVKWVITGNRPSPHRFDTYPDFIWFDGELNKTYSAKALKRIVMLSDDLSRYTNWNGKSPIPAKDRVLLKNIIFQAHRLHKPVRFWDAPDFTEAWKTLIGIGVDYINTDHIESLSHFLKEFNSAEQRKATDASSPLHSISGG